MGDLTKKDLKSQYLSYIDRKKLETAEEEKKELQIKRMRDEADLKVLLSMPEGRRFFYKILFEYCHINSSVFDTNQAIMSYKEGKRYAGLEIASLLRKINPIIIEQIINEYVSENRKNRKLIKKMEDL